VCDEETNICKFKDTCKRIERKSKTIDFEVIDYSGKKTKLSLPYSSLFVSGFFFGDSPKTCYLGVFKQITD